MAQEVGQGKFLALFRACAHEEEVRTLDIRLVTGLHIGDGDGVAHLLQGSGQDAEVGVASVKTHQVRVKMQEIQFHVQPSFSVSASSLSRSEKQVITYTSSSPFCFSSSAAAGMEGMTLHLSPGRSVKLKRWARSLQY